MSREKVIINHILVLNTFFSLSYFLESLENVQIIVQIIELFYLKVVDFGKLSM